MKKQLIRYLAGGILLAMFASCANAGKETASYAEPVVPPGDSLPISQVLLPRHIVLKEDKALVYSETTDTAVYAFSLPDFRFLYRTGLRGGGPEDFSDASRLLDFPAEDRIAADQMLQDRLDVFECSAEGMKRSLSREYRRRSYYRPQVMVNDSIAVVDCFNWSSGQVGVYSYNYASGTVVDSLKGLQSWIKSIQLGKYRCSAVNMFGIYGYGEHFALAYPLMNRIEFYRVSPQGRITLVKALGDERLDAAVENYGRDSKGPVQSFDKIPLYFDWFGAASERYLFIIDFHGMTPEQRDERAEQGDLGMPLDVYTWDGRLAGRLQLPVFGIFAVSEKYRRLYLIDPQRDFEYIYTYSYDFGK